jgi:hypothetical protein
MLGFFTILLVSGLLAKLVDSWLRKSEKDKLKEKLTRIWQRIDNSSLTSVSQAPLRVFSLILDTLLGNKVFTGKALWRTMILSTCLMIISLSVGGIVSNTPFAFKTPPWTSFDEQFNFLNVLVQTMEKQKDLNPQALEVLEEHKNFVRELTKYNTAMYKIIYSGSTILLILFVSTMIYIF